MPAALGWNNHITNGYASAPVLIHNMTSASVDAAYPIANYLDPDRTRVTRINFANSSGGVRAVILRKQVSATNDKTFRALAALNVRLPVGQWSTCYFGVYTVDLVTGATYGTHVPANMVPIPGTQDRYNVLSVLSSEVAGRAFVEFVVTTATGTSGYVEVGHIFAGEALYWTDGIDGSWKQLLLDDSMVERFPDGSWSNYDYPTRQGIELSRSLLTYAQAMGDSAAPTAPSLRSVLRVVGTSKPVLVVPRTASLHEMQALSVFGLIQGPLPSIDHQGGNRYATGLRIW